MEFQTSRILALKNKIALMSIAALCLVGCGASKVSDTAAIIETSQGHVFLNQGWDMRTRQELSHTSFGSRIVDYSWFMALEQENNEQLFRDDAHLTRLGFITDNASKFNPDALPVGFSRDEGGHNTAWIGLTCAACHTGQVNINGKKIRIDGGQSLINYTQFEIELLASIKATLAQSEKWERFFNRLPKTPENESPDNIQVAMKAWVHEREIRYAMNATAVPYGYGRLDAFGQIFNAVTVEALRIPENKHAPDAPTSFPVLWDASHLNTVQWNASAPNQEPGPLAQNSTTALAVYGTVDVLGHSLTYPSSIQLRNLGGIQKTFYQLVSPKWPETVANKLDASLVATGKPLYDKHCLQCHSLVENVDAKRKLNAVLVPITEVGTDPRMASNFANAKVKTGELEGKRSFVFVGKKFGKEESALDVVMHVTVGAMAHHPMDSLVSVIEEFAHVNSPPVNDALVYKARPINGVWASAPYLHNGSVPTVYDLLLPVAQRPTQFYVGNRELDIVKVGYKTEQTEASSLFDTSLAGNANTGHEYGTQLNEAERMALLEYVKSL